MRHGKRINHLGRKRGHRRALLANLATQLLIHKRIKTTVAKARALRKYVEPVITRAKEDSTHNRRMAFRYLRDKQAVKELFDHIADKIAERPGGYTRILKLGTRMGDAAEMAMIELVDYNDTYTARKERRRRRSRRRGGKAKSATPKSDTASEASTEASAEE